MTFNIYISHNSVFSSFNQYIDDIFTTLKISYKLREDYNNNIDLIIKAKYDFNREQEIKMKNNITIINCLKRSYDLMNKDLFKDFKHTPYFFTIFFNDKKYNKNIIKSYIDKYPYNKNFGKDYWILKNTKSGKGDGTFIVKTNELYNLENNKDFNKEIIKFPSKTTYIVQKYLENPIIYNNKKYDIRAHVFLITKYNNDKITYKFYLYNKITAKLTSLDYNLHNNDLKSHLTNISIQEEFNKYDLIDLVDKDTYNKIYINIKKQIKQFIYSDNFINKLKSINDYPYVYELFGVDILLDHDYNSYLIDFNTLPGLKTDNRYQTIIIMVKSIILQIIKIYNKYKQFINTDNIQLYKNIQKIYKFKKYFNLIAKI